MALVAQDCVTDARSILQDTNSGAYRVSDVDMLRYVNFALLEIAVRRPDLFTTWGDIPLTAGETYQQLPAGALRLEEIIRVKGGRSIKECSQVDLDEYNVNWHADAAAPTINWVRHPRSPTGFYVYPQAPAATTLTGVWAATPAILGALSAAIPISDAYGPIISDYVVWRSECRDDEYVSLPRAALFLEAFNASLGLSSRTKATADSDAGTRGAPQAVDPNQAGTREGMQSAAMQSQF